MTEAADQSYSPRCAAGALVAFGLLGGVLLAIGPKDYPDLHTILDTGMALLSGILALLLWDMGSRLGDRFPRWLAISFGVTSVLETVHVLVTVEWSGPLAQIAELEQFLRPATWPPAAHVLPIAIGCALWQLHRRANGVLGYAVAVAGLGAALFVGFQYLPTYTPPGPLGITRPALIAAPLAWLAVGVASWRLRGSDRLMPPLTLMAAALFLANSIMLYSQAPDDGTAVVAHLGKVCGYLALLLSLMQIASLDMIERIRAEMKLARLNEELEHRVVERTAALRDSERRFQDIAEVSGDWMWETDGEHRFTYFAGQNTDTLALRPEGVYGKTRWELAGASLEDDDDWREHKADLDAHRPFRRFRYTAATPGGRPLFFSVSGKPIFDEHNNFLGYRGTATDETAIVEAQRRAEQAETQLLQAQKMEAIGNLTGGMAHDFNNLLGVIIGNLDVLRGETLTATGDELVGEAIDAAMRGADLTRRLLAFARRQPLQSEPVDVNDLVTGIVSLLRRTLGEDIDISLDLAADVWPVVVDPAQLESSLVNLAANARDAMSKGGRLMIATANRPLDADYVAMHAELNAGEYAMIEVSDTGAGIPPNVISQIFEPFFTTKEPGKGTGLGLSMVFGFMKQSGGHINVYSEVGDGTTFRLYLPRGRTEDLLTEAGPQTATTVARGNESVLVVEDNDAMRRVVRRQLAELGYRVIEADRAAEGLELLEREDIDLLFTDIVMPGGMSGFDLARQAMARWPMLKVVLTSGFPEAALNGNDGAVAGRRLLNKPYRRDELARVLREILDEEQVARY